MVFSFMSKRDIWKEEEEEFRQTSTFTGGAKNRKLAAFASLLSGICQISYFNLTKHSKYLQVW
jgi:hypothetical protein